MLKFCKKCGEEKELETDFSNDKKSKDGKYIYCKVCSSKITITWQHQNKKRYNDNARAYKEKNREKIRASDAAFRSNNREKLRKQYKERRIKNPTYQTEYREKNKKRIVAYNKKYKNRNKDKIRSQNAQRRLLIANNSVGGVNYTANDVNDLRITQNNMCKYCSKLLTKYHVDHVLPISKGGTNCVSNICLACPTCNLAKGSKILYAEWIPPNEL